MGYYRTLEDGTEYNNRWDHVELYGMKCKENWGKGTHGTIRRVRLEKRNRKEQNRKYNRAERIVKCRT